MLYYQTLLHFLLIGLVAYAHDCLVQDSTSNEAATITDPRWRLQAGLIATTTYSLYTVSYIILINCQNKLGSLTN